MEAKVIDVETGKDLGRNQPGELCVKGALIMKEYWKRPETTAEAVTPDGWFNVCRSSSYDLNETLQTKDVAEIDNDGYIYIVDRAKDIIIRGGENIACAEVESMTITVDINQPSQLLSTLILP